MKRFFFLPSYVSYSLIGLVILSYIRFQIWAAVLVMMIVAGILFFFRRSFVPFCETLKADGEIYLSPVFGKVISVRQNVDIPDENVLGHEVRVEVSFLNSKGLFLPTIGEVTYLKANKGKKIPRNADLISFYGPMDEVAHTNLTLTSKNNVKTTLRFVDAPYSQRPTIWLKSGDRGRGAACFGHYLFGGTLFIYLPKNSDILVFESERLRPGRSVIAAIKDVN